MGACSTGSRAALTDGQPLMFLPCSSWAGRSASSASSLPAGQAIASDGDAMGALSFVSPLLTIWIYSAINWAVVPAWIIELFCDFAAKSHPDGLFGRAIPLISVDRRQRSCRNRCARLSRWYLTYTPRSAKNHVTGNSLTVLRAGSDGLGQGYNFSLSQFFCGRRTKRASRLAPEKTP